MKSSQVLMIICGICWSLLLTIPVSASEMEIDVGIELVKDKSSGSLLDQGQKNVNLANNKRDNLPRTNQKLKGYQVICGFVLICITSRLFWRKRVRGEVE